MYGIQAFNDLGGLIFNDTDYVPTQFIVTSVVGTPFTLNADGSVSYTLAAGTIVSATLTLPPGVASPIIAVKLPDTTAVLYRAVASSVTSELADYLSTSVSLNGANTRINMTLRPDWKYCASSAKRNPRIGDRAYGTYNGVQVDLGVIVAAAVDAWSIPEYSEPAGAWSVSGNEINFMKESPCAIHPSTMPNVTGYIEVAGDFVSSAAAKTITFTSAGTMALVGTGGKTYTFKFFNQNEARPSGGANGIQTYNPSGHILFDSNHKHLIFKDFKTLPPTSGFVNGTTVTHAAAVSPWYVMPAATDTRVVGGPQPGLPSTCTSFGISYVSTTSYKLITTSVECAPTGPGVNFLTNNGIGGNAALLIVDL